MLPVHAEPKTIDRHLEPQPTATFSDAAHRHLNWTSAASRIVANEVALRGTHVPEQGGWSPFAPASLPAPSYQPQKGSLQRSLSSSSSFMVDDIRQEDSSDNPSASGSTADCSLPSADRTFAFQTATRTLRQPSPRSDVGMTRVSSSDRGYRDTSGLLRPPLPHPNSRVRLLGASSARIDIDPSLPYNPPEDDWPCKRASPGLRNRVKLVWVYSFVLTVFVVTAGLYPLGVQFYRREGSSRLISGLALSVEDGHGDATSESGRTWVLDAALRCRMDAAPAASSQANSGANANSDVTDVHSGTSISLSNDIWGWKRHKGIVYANSHNDEMQGDRAFVSHGLHRATSVTDFRGLDRYMHCLLAWHLSKQMSGWQRPMRSQTIRSCS